MADLRYCSLRMDMYTATSIEYIIIRYCDFNFEINRTLFNCVRNLVE